MVLLAACFSGTGCGSSGREGGSDAATADGPGQDAAAREGAEPGERGVTDGAATDAAPHVDGSGPEARDAAGVCRESPRWTGGAVMADRTLSAPCSPYDLLGGITVAAGATLTIEPGTEVRFPAGAALAVGDGRLLAVGGQGAPIKLVAGQPGAAAGWVGIVFLPGTLADSQLAGSIVQGGGAPGAGESGGRGCLTVAAGTAGGTVTIETSTFTGCLQGAVHVADPSFEFARFAGNRFAALTGPTITVPAAAVGSIGSGNEYEPGMYNIITGGAVARTVAWLDQGVPWRTAGDIDVGSDTGRPVLTLDPGVEIRFGSGDHLAVGALGAGALAAVGRPSRPVRLAALAGAAADAGSWPGLSFHAKTMAGSRVAEAVVEQGGQGDGPSAACITIENVEPTRLRIDGVTLRRCARSGIHIADRHSLVDIVRTTFAEIDPAGHAIVAPANVVRGIGAGNIYHEGARNAVQGGQVSGSGTWISQATPYDVIGNIEVGDSTALTLLTIEPNVFRFGAEAYLGVGSSGAAQVKALGTAESRVVLTGMAPERGSWAGVFFEGAVLPGTIFSFVDVSYGGAMAATSAANVNFLDGLLLPVTIENAVVEGSLQYGILVGASAARPVLRSVTYGTGAAANLLGDAHCEDDGSGGPGPCPME